MAVLLVTETRESQSSTHVLDGASAYEAVDVGPRSWSLRRDANHCMCQLGGFLLLVGLGAVVLPNLPQPDPDPHHYPYITHALGVVANVIIALVIGSIDVVFIIGTWSAPLLVPRMMALIHIHHVLLSLFIDSYRNAPDWMCEYLLCRD